ncbi:MAG TPA: winged helix-turn-helix domain-containing protein [Hyphomicrobiaceae bacterium]|nr:winged helix-turn-helix domain-containing protein [Hyphomicrobiaceae bacterium]
MRYLFENCVLDADRRELLRGAETVAVAPQVFDLIHYLIRNRERVVSKDDLIAAIWQGRAVSDAALTTRINVARSAIGDSGEEQRLIKTLLRKGFRFVGAVREEQGTGSQPVAGAQAEEPPRPELTLPDKPSIAILPFANLSADPEQGYLADGIVDDIITGLSRFGELFVIARNSSFQYKGRAADVRQVGRELGVRYVLEGSLRRGGDRIRINAQLVDATTGTHRWAEHYDRREDDIFAVQDDVVRTIVGLLATHVRKAEIERTRAKPPSSWRAYDFYLQAADAWAAFHVSFRLDDLTRVRRLLERSLAVDANYARSHALMGRTYQAAFVNRVDGDFRSPAILEQAHGSARMALELDPNLPMAHGVLAGGLMWKREHDAALAVAERALAQNPSYVDWLCGLVLIAAGHARRAVEVLEAHMRLDPFYGPVASELLGLAHYMLKKYALALPNLRDGASRAPSLRQAHVFLAATYARLGQAEEAAAEVAEVLRLCPDYTIAGTGRRLLSFKLAADDEHYFDGLRKAGLPE